MNREIDGAWGFFRRRVSPAGGLYLNLSARQIGLLKDVQEHNFDYTDAHAIEIIGDLARMGLIHHQKGCPHEITEPGLQLLGLLGVPSAHTESLKRTG